MALARDATAVLDIEALACEVRKKYTEVATAPEHGFHFHTGRPLAAMLSFTTPPEVGRLSAEATNVLSF